MNSPRPRESALPMRVTVTATAAQLWVRIVGEVDLSNRDDLDRALSAIDYRSARGVRLDLRRLTFCDSAGCLVILQFERKARCSGHQTDIWVAYPTMRKLIGFLTHEYWPVESAASRRIDAANHG